MLGYLVAPYCHALDIVQPFKTDRIVKAPTHGLVHSTCRCVRYPYSRHLHLVKKSICDAFLGRFSAARVKSEQAVTTGAAAQKLVRFVYYHQAFRRTLLLVADMNADHASLRLHVLAVIVALANLKCRPSELLRKGSCKTALASAGSSVKKHVAVPVAGVYYTLDYFAVFCGEVTVKGPWKDILLLTYAIEPAIKGIGRTSIHIPPDGSTGEVEIIVKQIELAQFPLWRHCLQHFGV